MSKQEEIRGGLAKIACDTWYAGDVPQVWNEMADKILSYLHSQGVVIAEYDESGVSIKPLIKEG